MKKLRQQITSRVVFILSLLAAVVICAPRINVNEAMNLIAPGLILLNVCLVHGLFSVWFGKQKAGMGTLLLVSMPVWLLMQLGVPSFTYVLSLLLLALWSFDKAGRSKLAPLWYFVSGLGLAGAWLQEPIGVSISIALCSILLIIVKPRYIKHIARQSMLVLIMLIVAIGAVAAASWKFSLGAQQFLVDRLSANVTVGWPPSSYWLGVSDYHIALPGVNLIPFAVLALAGLGGWQLFIKRSRPRNVFILLLPIVFGLLAIEFTGVTALVLLSLAMIGVSAWALTGFDYLYDSWKQLFPDNKLARSLGKTMLVIVGFSLVLYSFWYINRAWGANPDAKATINSQWDGSL